MLGQASLSYRAKIVATTASSPRLHSVSVARSTSERATTRRKDGIADRFSGCSAMDASVGTTWGRSASGSTRSKPRRGRTSGTAISARGSCEGRIESKTFILTIAMTTAMMMVMATIKAIPSQLQSQHRGVTTLMAIQ